MSRTYEGYFCDRSEMIKLTPKDLKTLSFPKRSNREYQLVLEAQYKNQRTGKSYHFGRSVGRGAIGDYCFSNAYASFDYGKQFKEAVNYGYAQCAGGEQFKSEGSRAYTEDEWANWNLVKVFNRYLVIYRKFKERVVGMKLRIKPVVLKRKVVKKASAAELEKKYPTPKKYVKAQKALRRKIVEQEKRQKVRAFRRKRTK